MGRPRAARPVKLFCGLLGGDVDLLRRARYLLVKRFGPIDLESALLDFDQTEYYAEEMGGDLKRRFVSFERLISPDRLAEFKHETNALEHGIADDCVALDIARPVNLDPGYVHTSKLVLASTKDAAHRIHIGSNMYAEITLQFTHGAWRTLGWTYPDYRLASYHEYFDKVRDRLLEQCRAARTDPSAD